MDFFTSDTHFGHVNILHYCDRPFNSVEEMNAAMIARWNRRVGDSDTVYHLGDFALGPKNLWADYRDQLNGKIVFIRGNHDQPIDKFVAALHSDDRIWDKLTYNVPGISIELAHIPPQYQEERSLPDNLRHSNSVGIHFCGHVHRNFISTRFPTPEGDIEVYNVGVDVHNFEPVSLQEILYPQ